MHIRILNESDAKQYQELRLNGLMTNPEAFGSTFERESKFSLDIIKERIKPTEDKFVLGAIDESGSLIGMVALVRESGMKTSHKGNVFGMYVAIEMRRKGIGKLLILELICKAREMNGLEQIKLSEVSCNIDAKQLYRSVGFETYGIERRALKFKGEYCDEELMVLLL